MAIIKNNITIYNNAIFHLMFAFLQGGDNNSYVNRYRLLGLKPYRLIHSQILYMSENSILHFSILESEVFLLTEAS